MHRLQICKTPNRFSENKHYKNLKVKEGEMVFLAVV